MLPFIFLFFFSNFISLIQKGYYDGMIFHRVIAGYMIQGSDPQGTGTGVPGYCTKGEFSSNAFANDLKHALRRRLSGTGEVLKN